jgi:hypothetical protein
MRYYDPMPIPLPPNGTFAETGAVLVAGMETGVSPTASIGGGQFVYQIGASAMGLIRRLLLIQVGGAAKEGFSFALYNRGDVFNSDGTLKADAEAYRVTPIYTISTTADGTLLDNFGLQLGYANRDKLRDPVPATGPINLGRCLYLWINCIGSGTDKQFLLNFAAETAIST